MNNYITFFMDELSVAIIFLSQTLLPMCLACSIKPSYFMRGIENFNEHSGKQVREHSLTNMRTSQPCLFDLHIHMPIN